MENKKNRKVKLFLLEMIVLGVFNFVGIEHVFAQDKKETHITIKKGLNDEFLILSGNGPDVEVYECVEKVCVETQYWCDPGVINYTLKVDSRVCGNGGKGDHPQHVNLYPEDNCQAKKAVHVFWNYKKADCDWTDEVFGSPDYKKSKCSKYKCIAWKAPADKVLSLMPLIGQAMIDVNLIEY